MLTKGCSQYFSKNWHIFSGFLNFKKQQLVEIIIRFFFVTMTLLSLLLIKLLNKSIHFFNLLTTDPKLLNGSLKLNVSHHC